MTATPDTRYAKTADGVHIAYQIFGEGPSTILHCGVAWWHLEFQWTEPRWRSYLERLGDVSRVVLFDKRGTGLSDRVASDELPSMDVRMDDLVTVLDAAEADTAVLYGSNYGAQLAMVFAATFPERAEALVVVDGMARLVHTDDYPYGITQEQAERTVERIDRRWNDEVNLRLIAPTRADDPINRDWWLTMQRLSASPASAVAMMRTALATDVRAVLPAIQCPTLVVHHRNGALIEVGHGRYLAEHIPGAKYVELADDGDIFFVPMDDIADAVEEFLTGRPPVIRSDRAMAAVMFTDLVDSTAYAAHLGDAEWRTLLDRHEALVQRSVSRHRGRIVNTTGDGVVATFDGPGRAVQCAAAICDGVTALGLRARAGVHVGEIESRGDDIAGIAVHIAARVTALAEPNEVLVTRTVPDLVAGSGIEFRDRGEHQLKGVPTTWQLLAVDARPTT